MKKALSLILATLFILSTMSCLSVVSFGADVVETEIESNSTSKKAQEIDANMIYTGRMNSTTDVDWYKFKSDKDYFTIDFGMVDKTAALPNWGWDIIIYDGSLNEIKSYYNQKTNLVSAKLAMTGTIYVKVSPATDYNGNMHVEDIYYNIKANTTTDAYWESEYNDTSAKANAISVNKTYTGSSYLAKEAEDGADVDWYKFKSDKDYFTIDFGMVDKTAALPSWGWDIIIYDGSLNEIKSYYNQKTNLVSAKLAMTGTIYVKVSPATDYNGNMHVEDIYYNIKANTTTDAYWESEYNDTSAKANAISVNKTYTGSSYLAKEAEDGADVDWYKFKNEEDYFTIDFGMVDKTAALPDWGWDVVVYDSSMNKVEYYQGYKNYASFSSTKFAKKGTFYICVSPSNDYNGNMHVEDIYYNIKVNTAEGGRWESEYNNTSTTADKITQGLTYKGNISANGYDVDYYKFKSTSSAFKLRFNIDLNEVNVDEIYDGWKVTVYPVDSAANILGEYIINSVGTFETRVLPYEKGKEYFVKIEAVNPGGSPLGETYNFSVVDATEGNKWEVETGKTDFSSATKIKNGDKIYGNLYSGADKDYYRIYVPASGKIKVVFNRAESELANNGWRIVIQSSTDKEIENVDFGSSLNGTLVSKTVSKEGYYYVRIESSDSRYAPSNTIDYNLKISYTMTAPKISTIKNVTTGTYIKWTEVNDCAGYYVYRKAGSGEWKKLATVKGDSKVSYTDKTAKSGTKYSYKVKAYDGSTQSAFSSAKSIVFLAAPTAKTIASSKTGVTFTWTAVTGASGYEVYRATGSGSYKKIVTVKSGSTVKFVDKSAEKGETYKYKVRAYKGSTTSVFSGVKSIKDKY